MNKIYEFLILDMLDVPILFDTIDQNTAEEIRKNPKAHIQWLINDGIEDFMLYGKEFNFYVVFYKDLPYEYYIIEDHILKRIQKPLSYI